MLYFKNANGQVFAYDSVREREQFGSPDLVAMTDEEVGALTAPSAPSVPQSVTRFQALAALHLAGRLSAVQAIMAAAETPVIAKLAWDNALSFERNSPTLASLAGMLGMTPADLDTLFIAAAQIEA